MEPEPVWIESKDKFIEACKVPDGCECVVGRLNTDYELRSEAYSSVKKGWTPEGNYDDVGHLGDVPTGEVAESGEGEVVAEHTGCVGEVGGVPTGEVSN